MKAKIHRPRPRLVLPTAPAFYDPERDGVTFSTLTTFKECRERERLALEGWTSPRMGLSTVFGSITHELFQRLYGAIQAGRLTDVPTTAEVRGQLVELEEIWRDENPRAGADEINDLELTLGLAEAIVPHYFRYWKNDLTEKKWASLEHEFRLPLEVTLRDGRRASTLLRGKMDGVFFKDEKRIPWLFETKTRGRIEEDVISDILPFELQVNLYHIALYRLYNLVPGGVQYNIVRRPGHRQKQNEALDAFVIRIIEDVRMRPDWFFIRMDMAITQDDIFKAEKELYALITDFLDWWYGLGHHYKNSNACQNRYGTCHALKICAMNDYTHHYKRTRVFSELEEV